MQSHAGADLGLRYLSVAYVVRKAVDDQMIASGLSLSRAKVLQVLERDGPLRQASLAKSLRLAPRSVTQSIEGLERSGLVQRHPDPDDQRCKLVLLTPKGRATLSTGLEAGQGVLRSIFGALGPDRQANLDLLLNDIEAAVLVGSAAAAMTLMPRRFTRPGGSPPPSPPKR
jgi:DNA-binding MarR family transcriptional regulator